MRLRHGRVSLELHEQGPATGPALLLLHALRGSAAAWGPELAAWPGPRFALDFSGHGRSDALHGGAYHAELLAGDADVALEQIGPAAVVGAGLGAYVALLLAAARPEQVPGALLLPGPGLCGGGALPDFSSAPRPLALPPPDGRSDPALVLLEREIRPVAYAAELAAGAARLLLLEDGGPRPPWWEAARRSPAAEPGVKDLETGLRLLASGREPS